MRYEVEILDYDKALMIRPAKTENSVSMTIEEIHSYWKSPKRYTLLGGDELVLEVLKAMGPIVRKPINWDGPRMESKTTFYAPKDRD